MAQTKILLDSNSYFRLAQNIHPLLFQSFGTEAYTLYVHSDLMAEFKRSGRLRNKFEWVSQPEFVENRKRSLKYSKVQKKEIDVTFEYMWAHVMDEGLNPSEVDTRILATAAVMEVRVVTDDQDMIALASMYGVHQISSMELMKMMIDETHIDMEKVQLVVSQWNYDKDTPNRNFSKDYKRIFGEETPTE